MFVLSTRMVLFGLVVVAVGVTSVSIVGGEERAGEVASNLKIRLEPIPEEAYTKDSIPLRVTFENAGPQDVKIVRAFYGNVVPVFFSFEIARDDGTPFPGVRGGGKADFPEGGMKYIELQEHEGFYFRTDLAELITTQEELRPGTYSIRVTYHNQYGTDCFKGRIASEPITLGIE